MFPSRGITVFLKGFYTPDERQSYHMKVQIKNERG